MYMTHFTLTNALGVGNQATWSAIQGRRSGLAPCQFETSDIDTWVGQVPDELLAPLRNDFVSNAGANAGSNLAQFECRNNRLAQLALEADGFGDAVRSAVARYGAHRVGVFLGTSTSGILSTELAYRERPAHDGQLPPDFQYAGTQNNFSLAAFVSAYFGIRGPAYVVSSACSSSAKVFGNARRMLDAGFCDVAIVGGVDSLCLTTLYGFRALGLVSNQPCRPYDAARNGISIAEAAGFAILEKSDAVPTDRGSKPNRQAALRVLGVGESSDAYHMSSPHPEGRGALRAMRAALQQAMIAPSDVGYINLHGTATKTNDAAEGAAVAALFGTTTMASSTKGFTGHTLGAAGITEIGIAAMALQNQMVPGSLYTDSLDASIQIHYALENTATPLHYVMSNSFGFGGSNCSVVLGNPLKVNQ
jgi:3-oxoacyl-[acyl-carrier-protein] synthase I